MATWMLSIDSDIEAYAKEFDCIDPSWVAFVIDVSCLGVMLSRTWVTNGHEYSAYIKNIDVETAYKIRAFIPEDKE